MQQSCRKLMCIWYSLVFAILTKSGLGRKRFAPLLRSSEVIRFRIRITYRVTVHDTLSPSPGCLAFSVLYHRFPILSRTFFGVSEVVISFPVRLCSPACLVTMPAVTGKPLLDCTGIISQLRSFVNRNFPIVRICFLTVSRSAFRLSGLRSLVQGPVCASLVHVVQVSASSARVALVAMTVGLMALFLCPGFPGWTSIGSPSERTYTIR